MSSAKAANPKKRKINEISNMNSTVEDENIKPRGKNKSVSRGQSSGRGKDKDSKSNSRKLDSDSTQQNQVKNKKLLTTDEVKKIKKNKDDTVVVGQNKTSPLIIANVVSIYSIAERNPLELKKAIDEIFTNESITEEQVIKTMFLYFIELMGIAEKDSLQFFSTFISKNSDKGKLHKLFDDDLQHQVSFEKLVFFSQDKKALVQKKLLKKVCKIFVTDIIDYLPSKESYLTQIVERICHLSTCPRRLVRYSFTYMGLYFYKFLISEFNSLMTILNNLKTKLKNAKSKNQSDENVKQQCDTMEQAMEIIQKAFLAIEKHIIRERVNDPIDVIKRSVYDFLYQLEAEELVTALSEEDGRMLDVIFNSIRDQDETVRKTGLQLIQSSVKKYYTGNKTYQKLIDLHIDKDKLNILKLPMQKIEEQQADSVFIIKSLQLISSMIQINPQVYNQDNIQTLLSLAHFPHSAVKEEVANLLLTVSSEFDDAQSLMELQRFTPQVVASAKAQDKELPINFNEEPNKSQKQILKLIKLFSNSIMSKSQYIQNFKANNNTQETLNVHNLNKQDMTKIISQQNQEIALLMFQCFCKKTSVIFDIQSMAILLQQEEDKDAQEILANLIYTALNYCFGLKSNDLTKDIIYERYWTLGKNYLKLTVFNSLIQTFRVNLKIIDPLLKSMLLLGENLLNDCDSDQSKEMGKDFAQVLLQIFDIIIITEEPQSQTIVKSSLYMLQQLQTFFPDIQYELTKIVIAFSEYLKTKAVKEIFNPQPCETPLNSEALAFIQKFNICMSRVNLKQMGLTDLMKDQAGWSICEFTKLLQDNIASLLQIEKHQLNILLQVPFAALDQLLIDFQPNPDLIMHQQKMFQALLDFYLDFYVQVKENEHLQLSCLGFIFETIMLVGEDSKAAETRLLIAIDDLPRAKDFIFDMIQNVAKRIQCQDSIVKEQQQLLIELLTRDSTLFMGEIGNEFIALFGTKQEPIVSNEVKKLYSLYKKRDAFHPEMKKSYFYSMIYQVINTLSQMSEAKINRITEDAQVEIIKKNFQKEELGKFTFIVYEDFKKATLIRGLIKNVQKALQLIVMQNSNPQMDKQHEEIAYYKFVQDFLNLSMKEPKNYPMLLCLKSLMHKSFIAVKHQNQIVTTLSTFVANNRDRLNLSDIQIDFIDFITSQIIQKNQSQAQKNPKIDEGLSEEKKKEEQENIRETMSSIGKKRMAKPDKQKVQVEKKHRK